jgi:hypothetical protein
VPLLAALKEYHQDQNVIPKVGLLQGCCDFIFLAEGILHILELGCNQLFSVSFKLLSSMEKASLLIINYLHNKISSPINDSNSIPIHLHTICHKPLEIEICNAFL